MAKTLRDDFPQRIITKLRDRVAHRCSNPDCRVPTSAPTQDDPENTVNIGKAAHICAAAPGGPRYDTTMVKEQRRGIKNAIWLCGGCADKIDKDAKAFPISLLNQWKTDAERTAREELNTKLPCKSDGVNLVNAIFGGSPKSLSLNALGNVSAAVSNSLESLDPRFLVKTSYFNDTTAFSIHAKEDVKLKMKVQDAYNDEFSRKFNALINHGVPLEIDSQAVMFEGSGLLEYISSEAKMGKFILSNQVRKDAVQKIWLKNRSTNEIFNLDDIQGEISAGEKSFNFVGKTYGNLLALNYTNTFISEKSGKLTFTINIDSKKWDALPLNALPYFEKIHKLFSVLIAGDCELNTSLEIDGLTIFSANDPDYKPAEELTNFYVYCDFISLANAVLNHFNKTVIHNSKFKYLREVHELLFQLNKTLKGECLFSDEYDARATCTFIAEANLENIKLITNTSEPRALRLEQDYGGALVLFGETIQLPRSYILISSVIPLIKQSIDEIRPGDEVVVEWVPQDDCQLVTGFICEDS